MSFGYRTKHHPATADLGGQESVPQLAEILARLEVAERMAQELKNMLIVFHAAVEQGQLSSNPWQFDAISSAQVLAEWEALK